MKIGKVLITILLCFLITACDNHSNEKVDTQFNAMPITDVQPQFTPIIVDDPNQPLERVVSMDNYTLTVISEKSQYQVGDKIQIKAYLTYTGDKESVKLLYGPTPIYFTTSELTRNYPLMSAYNVPETERELERDVPYEEQYGFSGSYSESDPKEYVTFVKSLINNSFPKGHYVIQAVASFDDISEADRVPYEFSIDLEFEVVEAEG